MGFKLTRPAAEISRQCTDVCSFFNSICLDGRGAFATEDPSNDHLRDASKVRLFFLFDLFYVQNYCFRVHLKMFVKRKFFKYYRLRNRSSRRSKLYCVSIYPIFYLDSAIDLCLGRCLCLVNLTHAHACCRSNIMLCHVFVRTSHFLSDNVVAVIQCIAKLLHHTESNDISMFPLTAET